RAPGFRRRAGTAAQTAGETDWARSPRRYWHGKRALSLRLGLAYGLALALDRAIADVAAVLHAVPVDGIRQQVRVALRVAHGVAKCDGAEHPPAVRDHATFLIQSCAGVEDLAGQFRGFLEPVDDVAFAHGVRVSAGGHHDAQRRARVPLRLHLIEP